MAKLCKIHRTAVLQSTAVGYDIVIMKRGEDGLYNRQITVVYENVGARNMRRFYRMSDSWQSFYDIKHVDYHAFYNIFNKVK